MRYVAYSDMTMTIDRKRRKDEAQATVYKKTEDAAAKLGYGLVKRCPQCKSIEACMCSRE